MVLTLKMISAAVCYQDGLKDAKVVDVFWLGESPSTTFCIVKQHHKALHSAWYQSAVSQVQLCVCVTDHSLCAV